MKNLLLNKLNKSCVVLITLLIGSIGYAQITQRSTSTTATTSNSTLTIDKPTGVVAGDVMIVNILHNDTSNNVVLTNATRSGWTLIDGNLIYDQGSRSWRGTILYRIADGTEGSNFTFGLDGTTNMGIGSIIAFYNVDTSNGLNANGTLGGPFDVIPGSINVTNSSTSTANSITTANNNAAVIMLTQIADDSSQNNWITSSPSSLTELYDDLTTIGNDGGVGAAWAIKAVAGATGDGNSSISNTERNGAMLIALKGCSNNTITLTSAAGTNSQTKCSNTALTNITYSTTGATGATFSGLPSGVTGNWASNVVTISGTPSVSGIFNYTITLTGGCGAGTITETGTITVNGLPSITLGSQPSICTGTSSASISFSANSNGANQYSINWTPAGIAAGMSNVSWTALSGSSITLTGLTSTSGTYPMTISVRNSSNSCTNTVSSTSVVCGTANEGGTITLNSPSGTFTNIDFASYGTPNGSCGSFTNGSCHASNSASIVAAAAIGQSTFTIGANNVVFGDPCSGIGKRLFIQATASTFKLIVNPNKSIALSSAVGTNNQTKCINTAINNITYNTTGATGATFSGLPTGITGSWAANVVTISGTPTVSGSYPYTVTLIGGCGPVTTASGTFSINQSNTIALSSAPSSNNQSICLLNPITNITYTTTNATGATFSGLPSGVSGYWAANVVTIYGTPLFVGNYNYTVTLTGGCGAITATGNISVNISNSISLSSGAGTNNQTVCINSVMNDITFNTVSATGATFTGLPSGVTGSWAANVVTISGTPSVSGSFPYLITLTGGCGIPATTTGTITVNPNNTIVLSSAIGTNNQTRCINTAITNIRYNTTRATGATFSGLPTGVTGNWASNVVTISGTPSAAGTFNYTVTLTGGCGIITATGTITVNPNKSIILSSGVGTNIQSVCVNTALSDITFNTSNATGATFSGLPSGVTANWASDVVTISGTPTVSGTFNYTITPTGSCGSATATGTITVNPINTIALSSGAGTNAQTRCINTALTNIRYTTTRATDATFSGLPSGVTGGWAANVATISGTPTVSGTFNYTVTLTGGCGIVSATGTITVSPNKSITLSSGPGTNNQSVCINTSMSPITFDTVSATGATFSGLPTGITGNWAANVVTISGTPTVSGTFNYTVTLTGVCGPTATATGTITISTMPSITGSTGASRTGPGSLNLAATASFGVISWYANSTGGTSIGTGTSFVTPVISTTTIFYAEVVNGACTASPRTPVTATINYPEIDIQGNSVSIVSGDTTPAASDWTDFGTANITRTYTIRNIGGSLLTVGAITISGVNASEFTVTTPPASAVGIGSSTTFVVSFAPTAIGVRTATISIVNNDTDENPYTFAIQGTGFAQEIDIQGNAISIVDGDTTPTTADWTDFSTVAGTRTFTIRNTGNLVLNIGAISFTGTNASDFTVTSLPSATVGAFGTTTFTVSFAPSFINNRTATINIINDDSNENPYNFDIQGYGIVPEIDIQGNATSIVSGDTTPTTADWTDFSSVASTRTFTIYNLGNFPLNIGAITISGTNASEFTIITPPSASVAAFSSTTFVLQFAPTAVGTRTASISIVNNDNNEDPYSFSIKGTGVAQEIDVEGLGISIVDGDTVPSVSDGTDFGPADINLATVSRTFTIRNTGSFPLIISNPTISGLNASEFTVTTNPGTLSIAAGTSTSFVVTFNPSAAFTRVARINIVNNDSNENPYDFSIQGSGLLDNDGDGIGNNIDLDDDNDGVIDTIECGTCAGTPFQNGSFEEPVIPATSYRILPSTSVPGWRNSAENFIEIWSTGFNGVPAAAGNQFAELNANVAGTLYQSFCLNGAGGTINWSIKHRGRSGTDRADVRFGETLALAQASTPIVSMIDGNTTWGSYSGTYTIPIGQTNIVLAFVAVTSTGGLSYGNFIDDVQIIINQNCIDTDGDGVADINDVDDDNDGIPSIEEAGFKVFSNNKSVMDRSSAATWLDANNNGLNDYIESMITAGTYNIPDTDGDGVKDYFDLDSDNDTAFDVDEAGLLNGDGDINGDGRGDGIDSDGDGLLDLFDNSPVFGTTTRAYAQDSDINGIPDYLQLDSNDDGLNDIKTGLYGSLDSNNDGKIDGSGDLDKDGITDTFDTDITKRGSPRDLNRKLYLDFDGRNDYAEDTAILGGLSEATLMAWIDLDAGFNTTGFVIGQNRFHLRIDANRRVQTIANGNNLTYTTALDKNRWYHVAAVVGNGELKIYLNGKEVASKVHTTSIPTDATLLTLGKNPNSLTNFFKGKIDEVRVFNKALTEDQIQRMVHQEIANSSGQVRGTVIPKNVGSLPYANLLRYYRMDTFKDDIIDNLTTPTVDLVTGMKMYNHKVIDYQQAPMPFITNQAGTFATAVNDPSKDIRGLDIIENDASIVIVNHNITETGNNTDVGMIINTGVTVKMNNNTKLENKWYLKLDGKIDLTDKSQLIQTEDSDLEATSAGSIERDQQGQSNKFNYNYWSSPVSSINNTTINHGYTVAGVMKDGTNVDAIQDLLWTTAVNSTASTPIKLSSYWIFKFQNAGNNYYNWISVGQNGTLLPGQGYTLKGSNAVSAKQNYTFVGKPNNGTITNAVGANNLLLTGNPYPSAIDADKFIDDNAATITGALSFWEHYSTNNSHNTVAYQGGYATYTKTGGIAPVAPSIISGLGSSSKTPKRFIPVGQGFFVTGSATGGNLTYNNSQRLFIKEDNATSFTMFRTTQETASIVNISTNNAEDSVAEEQFMKIRIGFNSANNFHKQILLGFMNEHATAGIDAGYDAPVFETLTNDMYFKKGTNKLNISGEGFFNADNIYPLGVKNAVAGNVTFVIDNLENIDESQQIYIHDNVTNTYNSIKGQNYQVNLPAGINENRFSLTFKNGTSSLGTNDNELVNGMLVSNSLVENTINIKNQLMEANVKSVLLFNMIGQQISSWDVENLDQSNIVLSTNGISTGTYIVKVITDKGNVSKKILIK